MHRARKALSCLQVTPKRGSCNDTSAPSSLQDADDNKKHRHSSNCEQPLTELERWYETCTSAEKEPYQYNHDVTLDDEILDEEKIERDVKALVPGIANTLNKGYCHSCQEFPHKWSLVRQFDQEKQHREKKESSTLLTKLSESGKRAALQYNRNSFKVGLLARPRVAHLGSIYELEAASLAGCRLCRLFIWFIGPQRLTRAYKVEERLKRLEKPTTIFLTKEDDQGRYVGLRHSGYFSRLSEDFMIVHPVAKPTSFSPRFTLAERSNEGPIDKAKQWLKACDQDHPLCQTKIVQASLNHAPTRLLRLDSKYCATDPLNIKHPPSVRLVETDPSHKYVYATLSHCWGNLQFTMLTLDNLEPFKIDIPLTSLTKTFQDAIHVTFDLGVRYLWVDSLCIIQDSIDDWKKEAGLMASVYGESHINLAASDSKNGSEGMFLQEPNHVGGALLIPESWGEAPAYAIAPSNFYSEWAIRYTALSSRAWALQERLLPVRSLRFGKRDLFWECKTKQACESYPNGILNGLQYDTFKPQPPFRDIWEDVIHMYTSSRLTNNGDKLTALSGIARVAQQECGDAYVAGIWRMGMERQLCWYVPSGYRRHPRDKVYRAPSWSWASIDPRVCYPSIWNKPHPKLLSRVHDVRMAHSGPDEFGRLSGAVLTLACSGMLSGRLCIQSGDSHILISGTRNSLEIIAESDYEDYKHEHEVIMVPIVASLGYGQSGKRAILGLVLESTGRRKGEFKRLGFFCQPPGEQPGDIWQEFRAYLKSMGPNVARKLCVEVTLDPVSGKDQYLVEII